MSLASKLISYCIVSIFICNIITDKVFHDGKKIHTFTYIHTYTG